MSTQGSFAVDLYEIALGYPGLYNLTTVNIGAFNNDTRGFYDWLGTYLASSSSQSTSRHVEQQIYSAIYEPESHIAVRLRELELGINPLLPTYGPEAYLDYLIRPYFAASYWILEPELQLGLMSSFMGHLANYKAKTVSGSSGAAGFADYLANLGYLRQWGPTGSTGASPSPTPRPRSTTTPSTSTTQRNSGAVLYDRPLTEWTTGEFELGWFAVEGDSFHIGVYGGDGHTMASWTERTDFSNISASVEVRSVTNEPSAVGCVAIRHDVDQGEYQFCILGDGRTWATYDYADANGEWQSEVILESKERDGTRPSSQWNTIELAAYDNQLWFLVNGVELGTVQHNARSSGAVAIQVTNWDTIDAEFEFRNLIIREVN